MEDFRRTIQLAVKKQASDVHLVTGSIPYFRIHQKIYPVKKPVVSQAWVAKIIHSLLNQTQIRQLEEFGSIDVSSATQDVLLRVNIHKQSSGYALSIRILSTTIPSQKEINLPESVAAVTALTSGFVIVTGAAGVGKSTTLAVLINQINQFSAKHIITLEDPIEYRFVNKKCLIEQRQFGSDFKDFPGALETILRQDPDVIVVGEMRDPKTIALALTAAETGHLVLSTLHAPNASEAIERIVNVFNGPEQQQILIQLAATLKMVVAQQLLPKVGGGLIAAHEVLVNTRAVENAIRNNNLSAIRSAIQTGKKYGMSTMDQVIKSLKADGVIE